MARRGGTPPCAHGGSIEADLLTIAGAARVALRRVQTAAPLKLRLADPPVMSVRTTPPCSHGGSIEASWTTATWSEKRALRRVHTAAPLKLQTSDTKAMNSGHSAVFTRRLH